MHSKNGQTQIKNGYVNQTKKMYLSTADHLGGISKARIQ